MFEVAVQINVCACERSTTTTLDEISRYLTLSEYVLKKVCPLISSLDVGKVEPIPTFKPFVISVVAALPTLILVEVMIPAVILPEELLRSNPDAVRTPTTIASLVVRIPTNVPCQ